MKTAKHILPLIGAVMAIAPLSAATVQNDTIVGTAAYAWVNDTIVQGEFRAWAPTDNSIVSTYHAQPGYYMGIKSEWNRKNDLSAYPALTTPNRLHTAIYNLGHSYT